MGSVRKRPAGAWEARWYGPDGRQRSRNFNTKGDATRHVQAMEGAKVRGDYLDQSLSRTPFSKVAEEWYETTQRLRRKTRAGYKGIIDYHLVPEFGATPIARIDAARIDRFIAGLKKSDGSPTKAGTARNVLRVLGPIMQHAVKARMIPANPVAQANRPKMTRPNAEDMPFLTAQQVRELADEVGPKSSTLIYFAVYTGMRAGEITALQVKHLDLIHATARIEGSIAQVNGELVFGAPKNGRTRVVTIPRAVVDMLTAHTAGKRPDDYVFGGEGPRRHGLWYQRTFRPAVKRLVAAGTWPNKLLPLRFHDLRHTCAALCIANGEHPKAVQERLGHSSIAITMDRYGKLYEGHDQEVAERLNATFTTARDATPQPEAIVAVLS